MDKDMERMIGKTIRDIQDGIDGLEFHFTDGSVCEISYSEYPDGSFRAAYYEWKDKNV